MANMTLREELRAIREELGLSREQMCYELRSRFGIEIPSGTLARYENGKTKKIPGEVILAAKKLAD